MVMHSTANPTVIETAITAVGVEVHNPWQPLGEFVGIGLEPASIIKEKKV